MHAYTCAPRNERALRGQGFHNSVGAARRPLVKEHGLSAARLASGRRATSGEFERPGGRLKGTPYSRTSTSSRRAGSSSEGVFILIFIYFPSIYFLCEASFISQHFSSLISNLFRSIYALLSCRLNHLCGEHSRSKARRTPSEVF